MNGAKDIRSYGYKVGSIPCGKANLITDVPGVKVGTVRWKKMVIKPA